MEKYYRKPVSIDESSQYNFQCIEWHACDEEFNYIIRTFGVDEKGRSVCCTITDYKPFFYIKIPMHWTKINAVDFVDYLDNLKKEDNKNVINYYARKSLIQKECCIVFNKEFHGFTNSQQFKFFKLTFNSHSGMKSYKYAIEKLGTYRGEKIFLYDLYLDPYVKFFHEMEISPSNWVLVKDYQEDPDTPSTCQINIIVNYKNIRGEPREINADFIQASFDIETYSQKTFKEDGTEYYPFPDPANPENAIYQIGTCFKRFNDKDFFLKTVLTLKKCCDIEGAVVIECKNEKDLLIKWKKLMSSIDPDIIYHYNGDMFDCNYICVRSDLLGIKDEIMEISRLFDHASKLNITSFSSSAYGTSDFKRLVIPGRLSIDVLIHMKRNFKENSYKLDSVAHKYLGLRKLDVTAIDIFKAYEEGSVDSIKRIAEYCIQDTVLPQMLVDTLFIMQSNMSMSDVTCVPVKYILERGQEIKVISQMYKHTKKKGYLIPYKTMNSDNEKFQGATVLDPIPGLYDIPITVLDFASLYPSIIRAHKLCFTTIVLDEVYMNIPDIEYMKVSIDDKDYYYTKNTDSILPEMLDYLAIQRKKYKKLMNTCEDPKIKEVYNNIQLAYKISMNSVYGILGSGRIGCKPIASSVTRIGRDMIAQTKNYIESTHTNVYPEGYSSDNLKEDDVVVIRKNYVVSEIKVKDIPYEIDDLEIKTNGGWRRLLGRI